jgi:hypothetical protein
MCDKIYPRTSGNQFKEVVPNCTVRLVPVPKFGIIAAMLTLSLNPGFRIRIDLMRIRIWQDIFLIADSDPDPGFLFLFF